MNFLIVTTQYSSRKCVIREIMMSSLQIREVACKLPLAPSEMTYPGVSPRLGIVERREEPPHAAVIMAFCLTTGFPSRLSAKQSKCSRPRISRTVCVTQSHTSKVQTNLLRRDILRATIFGGLTALLGRSAPAEALNKKRMLAKAGPAVELPGGIVYRDITIGKGNVPRDGDTVAIHYSLFYDGFEVESSRESQGLAASPIGFTYGARTGPGSVLHGLNDGMAGMKVGGLRFITVPPELAYGEKGKTPMIPGSATVEFAVSLLSCKRSGSNPNSIIDPKSQVF